MLFRSAVVGSALAANPVDFVFRPVSAYAAACECRGQGCSCGTACCDGYTEFCCTITGKNTCPSGTVTAGWWRAEGSGLCGGASRYYMDCNQVPGAPVCGCQCAGGSCGNRVTCCVHFRYGQCHQEFPQVGAIVCRVVTCTPPWQFDPSCVTTDAVDNATAAHDAPCLHQTLPPEETTLPSAFIYNGDLDTFAVDPDGSLTTRYYQQGKWKKLRLGGGCQPNTIPVVVRDYGGINGRLDVFVEATNGLAHAWYVPGNSAWGFEILA
jgi:hypothetical protein